MYIPPPTEIARLLHTETNARAQSCIADFVRWLITWNTTSSTKPEVYNAIVFLSATRVLAVHYHTHFNSFVQSLKFSGLPGGAFIFLLDFVVYMPLAG